LIGLQPRGIYLLYKIIDVFSKKHTTKKIIHRNLDYTFFRDDFRRGEKTINPKSSNIDISIENKKIVLIDDVLFTGRSIRAAMSSIDSYGRPKSIELMVLIDRRFKRELPIEANYFGAKIDTIKGDKVSVIWGKEKDNDVVYIER
jgi:pyrimidine operon attenuation protein/uracil phosphoribosyltransferase